MDGDAGNSGREGKVHATKIAEDTVRDLHAKIVS